MRPKARETSLKMFPSRAHEPDLIIDFILKQCNITRDQIRDKTRKQPIPRCRHIIQYFLYTKTRMSLHEIADIFSTEKRTYDHSSVIHGISVITNDIEVYPDWKQKIETMNDYIVRIILNS